MADSRSGGRISRTGYRCEPVATIGIAIDEIRGRPPTNGARALNMSPTASGALDHRQRGSKQRILLNWIPGKLGGISWESQHEKASRRSTSFLLANLATEIPFSSSAQISDFS